MTDSLRSRRLTGKGQESGNSDLKHGHKHESGPQLKYTDTLLWSLLPPLIILVAFGGKPTYLTLGIGGTIAFILYREHLVH